MASDDVDLGTGTTVVFGTSGFSHELTSIQPMDLSREPVDVTHLGSTTAREFVMADLYDAGDLQIEGHHNPDTDIPIDGAFETVTVTFPSGATLSFSAAMSGYSVTIPLEDKITFTATWKINGAITETDADTALATPTPTAAVTPTAT